MRKLISLLLIASLYFAAFTTASAQYGPYQPPSESVSIVVDKLVSKPITTSGTVTVEYVDNLGSGDAKFGAGADVFFKIKVKNTSNITLKNVTIKDFLPSYVEPIEGPGTIDKAANTVTISGGDFAVNEEKIYVIKARVLASDRLPDNVTCITNKAEGFNDRVRDEDTAQLCIEKQVQGVSTTIVTTVTKIPSTGPEHGVILYSLTGLAGLIGLRLRKKS